MSVDKVKKICVIYGVDSSLGNMLASAMRRRKIDVVFVLDRLRDSDSIEDFRSSMYEVCLVQYDGNGNPYWKDLEGLLGQRSIDYLILNPSYYSCLKNIGDMTYDEWKNDLNYNLNYPIFLTLKLSKLFTPQARIATLFDNFTFVPYGGLGGYCTSQAALRIAVNILQVELPNLLTTSILLGDSNRELTQSLDNKKRRSLSSIKCSSESHFESNNYSQDELASFVAWVLTKTNDSLFSEEQWDVNDSDHARLWKRILDA